MSHENPAEALREAEQTIAHQAREIAQLRQRLNLERFAEELREALSLAGAVSVIASPITHTRLLEMIVEAAAQVTSARAASLFLVEEATQELVFEVALGQKAQEVKKFRLPLGRGIAGLVAMTGQPMAVSNAQQDFRQASDIAQAVGYLPQSILCMPLFYDDQVIGVLELLDKEGASAFSPSDMEILELFAQQAAVAIEHSRLNRDLAGLVSQVLASYGQLPAYQREHLEQGMQLFTGQLTSDDNYKQMLELARLVHKIAWQGQKEFQACQAILSGFAQYLEAKAQFAVAFGGVA